MASGGNAINGYLGLLTVISLLLSADGQINNAKAVHYQLEEEGPAGKPIGSLIRDAELDLEYSPEVLDMLHYQFLTDPGIRIHINYDTGVLSTSGRVDREGITSCTRNDHCEVIVDIAIQPVRYFKIYKIYIEILDINDNPPVFDMRLYEHSLKESASLGSSFIVPSASDRDSPPNGIQTYELHSDMNLEPFALEVKEKQDGSLGLRIKLIEALDREVQDSYTLTLMAYDGGIPRKSASIEILVSVEDSNDNDPAFENSSYAITIPEGLPLQSTILQVRAEDHDIGDNGRILYTFSQQTVSFYGDVFNIEPDTGNVFIVGEVDHEKTDLYNLIVTAQDMGPDSQPTDTNVVVHVEDINDNAPTIVVNTLSSSGTNRAEIPEDSPVGTFVAHVTISDPDSGANGEYNCSLTDSAFRLGATEYVTEYQIFSSTKLDREIVPQYNLALVCIDHGKLPLRAIQNIIIDIMDINDHTPTFSKPSYTDTIIENNYLGASVLQIHASDEDAGSNAAITYEVSSNVINVFQVDQSTGIISAKTEINREETNQYRFYVIARDDGSPPRSSSVSVVVMVEDVNDERPTFSEPTYTFTVNENEDPGTLVGTVEATDRDAEPYNEFYFSFVHGTVSTNSFMIDPKSGRILTRQRLDREHQADYQLVVSAKDSITPRLSSTATVSIFIRDENDNKPEFIFPTPKNSTVYISNKVPVGYNITQVRGHDMDIGPNGDIFYSIHSGNTIDLFSIDHHTGVLSTNVLLTGLTYEVTRLQILARDHGSPQPSIQTAELTVIVNQSIPYFPPGSVHGSILSNQNLMIVISVACGCAVVAVILIVAIVFIHRQDKIQRTRQYNCRIEAIGRLTAKEAMAQNMQNGCCHDDMEKKPLEKDFKTLSSDCGGVNVGSPACGTGGVTSDPGAKQTTTGHSPDVVSKMHMAGSLEVSATESVSSQGSDQSNADSGRGASEEGDRRQRVNISDKAPSPLESSQQKPRDTLYNISENSDTYPLHCSSGYSSLKAHAAAQSYTSYPNPQFTTFSHKNSTFGHRQQESSFSSKHEAPRGGYAGNAQTGSRGTMPGHHHGDRPPLGHSYSNRARGYGEHASKDTIPCDRKETGTSKGVLV